MLFWMYGLVAFIISPGLCAFLLTVRFDFQNFVALLTRITFLCSEQLQAIRLLLQESPKQNLIFKVKTFKGYIVLLNLKACL